MTFIPEELRQIASQIKEGSARKETVRTLLTWFRAERRGQYVIASVRAALDQLGMVTSPDFESAYIDESVEFHLASNMPPMKDGASNLEIKLSPETSSPLPPATGAFADPTYRIGKLVSANRQPVGIAPDQPIREAVTLMLAHDFSQLPVWQNERNVKGIVSWASIGARLALEKSAATAIEFCEQAHFVSSEMSLFAAIPSIIEHQYVLVRSGDNRVTGIVTTTDLSLQFRQLAEPFLLLGEIENHVRRLIDGKFSIKELAAIKLPGDKREIAGVASLNFGEYVRLLEKPDNWKRISGAVDRSVFTTELSRIRTIRNDVMHFDPDGIASADLEALRRFAKFLQTLRDMGAT